MKIQILIITSLLLTGCMGYEEQTASTDLSEGVEFFDRPEPTQRSNELLEELNVPF
jgi:hypothetical protein